MKWFFAITALLCMAYYGIIVLHMGFGTSGAALWLILAVIFLLLSAGLDYYEKHKKTVALWIPVSVTTLMASGLVVFFIVEVMIFAGSVDTNTEGMDYLIVMGTQVKNGGVDVMLEKRLDRTLEYSRENPDTILVLSGGRRGKEGLSQAQAMASYLFERGVPREKMLLEMTSGSVVEGIISSKVIIDNDRKAKKLKNTHKIRNYPSVVVVEDKPVQTGLLTSNYNVFRCREISRKWGLGEIYTISSKSDKVLIPHLYVRECAAILKDKLMGNM